MGSLKECKKAVLSVVLREVSMEKTLVEAMDAARELLKVGKRVVSMVVLMD